MNQDFASHYNPLTEWFWLIDIPGILCETSKLIFILKKKKNWYVCDNIFSLDTHYVSIVYVIVLWYICTSWIYGRRSDKKRNKRVFLIHLFTPSSLNSGHDFWLCIVNHLFCICVCWFGCINVFFYPFRRPHELCMFVGRHHFLNGNYVSFYNSFYKHQKLTIIIHT